MPCSTETRDALHRARELVHIVEPSDLTAFAALQIELGHDVDELRAKGGHDHGGAYRRDRPEHARLGRSSAITRIGAES